MKNTIGVVGTDESTDSGQDREEQRRRGTSGTLFFSGFVWFSAGRDEVRDRDNKNDRKQARTAERRRGRSREVPRTGEG